VDLYLHSPNTSPQCGAQLKHRDSFTFTILCLRESITNREAAVMFFWKSYESGFDVLSILVGLSTVMPADPLLHVTTRSA